MAKIRKRGLPDVVFTSVDGNIGVPLDLESTGVTGILFDISTQPNLFSKGYGKENAENIAAGDVVQINTLYDAEDVYGIKPREEVLEGQQEEDVNFMYGIPHYHISEFFRGTGNKNNNADLYVMFADCSKNWDAIDVLQNASGGTISQIGVYTEQNLWGSEGTEDGTYALKVVGDLQDKAEQLADEHAPAVIVLSANTGNLGGDGEESKQIDLKKIPECLTAENNKVAIIFGQANHSTVNEMQMANPTNAPVGVLGMTMGLISIARVHESIGHVRQFNMFGENFQRVELGFGDLNIKDGGFVSKNALESIPRRVLDELADKGYNFPIKYNGIPNGVFMCYENTGTTGDYRTVAINRVVHKARRGIRLALLPQLHSSVLVSRVDGTLTSSKITELQNLVVEVLDKMHKEDEISGYRVSIDPKQQVLVNDTIHIKYVIVPKGTVTKIPVEDGLDVNTK